MCLTEQKNETIGETQLDLGSTLGAKGRIEIINLEGSINHVIFAQQCSTCLGVGMKKMYNNVYPRFEFLL